MSTTFRGYRCHSSKVLHKFLHTQIPANSCRLDSAPECKTGPEGRLLCRLGDRAEISDSARPEVRLTAVVSRFSGELDPKTRTLLTELDLDNKQGLILAGSFVQVSLTLATTPLVEIPAEALLSKDDTAYVAVVTAENKANFRKVTVADSDGKMVRLTSGLSEGESVVLNSGFGLSEGMHVEPVRSVPK